MTVQLTDDQRSRLAALADVVIPPSETMPSASEIGVQGKWIDKSLAARPDLLEPLLAFIDHAAASEPAAAVESFIATDPESVEQVLLLLTCSYYMSPKVRKRLGYPGQKANPPYPDESEYYLRDGLLDPVIERGPIYIEP
jgi:hypothetical protein